MIVLHELITAHDFLRQSLQATAPLPSIMIHSICADSSRCTKNSLFVAKKGASAASKNGHDFIDDAIARGAAALVIDESYAHKKFPLPTIVAEHSEEAFPYLCEAFYGFPSKKLSLIGITGTNGKTSTSFMLHAILNEAGFKTKILGTLGIGEPGSLTPLSHTTMEADFISENLARMLIEGVSHVVMEVSSHALVLNRVNALCFAAVGLSNITQDHLDFHQNLESYIEAKSRLFFKVAEDSCKKILPIDHPFATISALKNVALYDPAKVMDGLPFIGDFHHKNAQLASSIAMALGIDATSIKKGLRNCRSVPGRLELVSMKPCRILVDYAHTPDALQNVLATLKKIPHRHLILVMGCGGDRDALKRPLMGEIACKEADFVIVTDDNPRTEDPNSIRRQIIAGIPMHSKMQEIGDRQEAIYAAIQLAHADDIVLIAGKGHEDYQIYGTQKRYFSDQKTALMAVETLWQK